MARYGRGRREWGEIEMITLLIILVVVGFVLFLFNRFMPLDADVKSLINYVVIFILIVIVVLFILDLFDIYHSGVMNKLKG